MTDSPTPPPIIVNATPATDQWQAGARQIVLILGPLATFSAAAGALTTSKDLNLAITIIGPLATLASIIMGQLKTRHDSQRQADLANRLPDYIAHTRKPSNDNA